jgi:hypothetical protein
METKLFIILLVHFVLLFSTPQRTSGTKFFFLPSSKDTTTTDESFSKHDGQQNHCCWIFPRERVITKGMEQQGKVAIEKIKFLWTTNIFTWREEKRRETKRG